MDGVLRQSAGNDQLKTELEVARKTVDRIALVKGGPPGSVLAATLESFRVQAKQEFDAIARQVEAAGAGTDQPAQIKLGRRVWVTVGRVQAASERLDQVPFLIECIKGKLHFPTRTGENDYVADFTIKGREVPVPADMRQLKTDIDGAVNVITAVFNDQLYARPVLSFSRSWDDSVRTRQGFYLKQLAGVAEVGLCTTEPTHTQFAKGDLERIKALFKLQEGGRIKNRYNNVLFAWCALITVIAMAAYWAVHEKLGQSYIGHDGATLLYNLRNFWALAAGTAIGTWLSFSLRKQDIAFKDLAALEPDRLDPWARVAFMVGLSGLVGLLLFTGAIVAGVGSADGGSGMRGNGAIALVIGLLAGVAERALGNAVGRRGQEFADAVGGATAPTTPVANAPA